ncbi:MAG: lipid-A-disaccharide synthase [Chitinophagales bacterium]|nr:lipid-A-disaccharide synthase [Chitinophagales bacterium]
MRDQNHLFIISGEASGDLHGSNLVKELLTQNPSLKISAWGGGKMQAAGAHILKHYRELAFMGFYEVIRNLPTIIRNFGLVKKQILEVNPKIVVLIDYPGFNLRLLPWLKKNGFVVIYYIAPQAWAWKENRVKKMAKYIDELLVILPFEEEFFQKRGVKTEFVGHPLLQSKVESRKLKDKSQIALLPGSRKQEVEHILPVMLSVQSELLGYKFLVAAMSHLGKDFYRKIIGNKDIELVFDDSEKVINNSDIAMVSSGTATLQTALAEVPQIVCYKSGLLNYEIGKRLIKVPFISLVNLIFGREIVKELIQDDLSKENLLREIRKLEDETYKQELVSNYRELKSKLGQKNASKRVADIIIQKLNK